MGAALVSPCVSPPESITMPPPSGVNNIFALLDDDNENEDDGFTVVAKPVKPPAKAAKAKEEEPKREVRKQKNDRPARGKGDKRRDDRPYGGTAVGKVLHAKAVDRTTGVTRQMVFLKVLQKELLRLMERTRPHPPLRKRKRKRTP